MKLFSLTDLWTIPSRCHVPFPGETEREGGGRVSAWSASVHASPHGSRESAGFMKTQVPAISLGVTKARAALQVIFFVREMGGK